MSSIIDFLERMGQDAQLRHATEAELEGALARAGIEPALRSAVLGQDPHTLESLLGVNPNMCCLVNPAKEDEEEEEEEEETEEEDDEEEEEDDEGLKPRDHAVVRAG